MITLNVEKLAKSYGRKSVLKNISFRQEGGILGIAGPNGSGKSTLLKCIAGLLTPTAGSITWNKDEMELKADKIKTQLGFAAPYVSLYMELTVSENLEFLQKIRSESSGNDFTEILEFTGLADIADQSYGSLSTGQKQRAKLAASLFHNPQVLLLDEPGSGLDKKGRSLVKQIAEKAQRENKLLIIASNIPEELNLCETVYSVGREEFRN